MIDLLGVCRSLIFIFIGVIEKNVGGSANVVWKTKIMGRSIANPQLQSFSDFIWKSRKKAGPLNYVFRHEV